MCLPPWRLLSLRRGVAPLGVVVDMGGRWRPGRERCSAAVECG